MATDEALNNRFVPDDFEVPLVYETKDFQLRKLTVADVDKDYEAVMSSSELLHVMVGNGWPRDDFSRKENLEQLAEHQQEFEERMAFAYTVVSLDEEECLGCVYSNPPRGYPADARVYLWVRQSASEKGLDLILYQELRKWLEQEWLFKNVLFPGRHDDGSWYPQKVN